MKVLHIGKYYSPVRGGIETYVKTICEGLAQRRVAVTCAVSSQSHESSSENILGVNVKRFGTLLRRIPLNPTLPRYLKKNSFDIVHIHLPNPSAELACLLVKPKRLIVSYHADIIDKMGSSLYLPLQKRLLRRADQIIVSSSEYARTAPMLRESIDKCAIIPYSIDSSRFATYNKKLVEKLRCGQPPYFLFVGRLVAYKGVDVLLQAMKHVQGTAIIAGDGPLFGKLRAQAALLGIDERVHFFRAVSDADLPSFYHAADVFVLPSISRAEAFGIVQLEAMAAGKPVISTRIPGVDSVNQHFKTGIAVLPKDSEDLAFAMNLLGQNKELRAHLGKSARKRALEFSKEAMVEQTYALYKRVISLSNLSSTS